MSNNVLHRIQDILVCPFCENCLEMADDEIKCSACGEKYGSLQEKQIDLRLRRKKTYHIEFEIGTGLLPEKGFDFKALQKNISPQVDFSKLKVPHHLTNELLSYFPKAKGKNRLMLDLGCGSTVHREVCEHAGFEYVGLDYSSREASILGDAHSLPFKKNSFEFILSIAVLEHIRYPFVMSKEVYRVLQPGGTFIGSVAFLEPFHGDSFYHHTHLGTFNSLNSAGFDIKYIAPNARWSVLHAHVGTSLFPKLPRLLSSFLVLPTYWLHRIWWQLGCLITKADTSRDEYRLLKTTGSFFFIACK